MTKRQKKIIKKRMEKIMNEQQNYYKSENGK